MMAGLVTQGNGTLRLTKQLVERFKDMCGATACKQLKALVNDGKPLCPCDDCIRNAVTAYGELVGI